MYTQSKSRINTILIFFFCGIFIFASHDGNNASDYTKQLTNLFLSGIILHSRFFSIFDFLLIFISIWIITEVGIKYGAATKSEKFLVLFAYIYLIANLFNPNNSETNYSVLGLPLLVNVSSYTSLLFLTSIYLIKDNKEFALLLKKIVPMILSFAVIRAVFQLILYVFGMGNDNFFGVKSALTEDDTLLILILSQNIFLALFLSYRRNKYLIFSLILFLVQLLSFRRTNLFIAIFSFSIIIIAYYIINRKKRGMFLFYFFVLSIVLLIFIQSQDELNFLDNQYFKRYFGMFYLPQSSKLTYEADSGHFEHLQLIFYQFLQSDIFFWGFGFQPKFDPETIISTGNVGIHNAYIDGWVQWGILFFIYMLGTIFIFFNQVANTIKNIHVYNKDYLLIRIAVISYFLGFLIGINFFGSGFFTLSKHVVLRTLILAFLIKIKPETFKLLFNYK